jgi:hypothetical protein
MARTARIATPTVAADAQVFNRDAAIAKANACKAKAEALARSAGNHIEAFVDERPVVAMTAAAVLGALTVKAAEGLAAMMTA